MSSQRYPSRLESRAGFFASTRDECLSPRVHLECNPEIPVAPGEEHWLLDTSLDEVYWPCSSPTHHLWHIVTTSPRSCLFFPGAFLALFIYSWSPICSVKSPGLSGQGQLSGSLCPSPGASPLLFSDAPCPSSASGWTVSLLSMPPLLQALLGCQGHRGQWRASTHLANTEASSLLPARSSKCPEPCRCTALRGEGAELRLGGCGQGPRAPKRGQNGGGKKGKVRISAGGILKV